MSELTELAIRWPFLTAPVIVLVFAPDAVLAACGCLYPPGHPKREDMRAHVELNPRRRGSKALWVLEQMQIAIWAARGRGLRVAALHDTAAA